MIEKDFDQLTMKEKYGLQKIMKKKRLGDMLTDEENALYLKFHERFEAEEGKAKSKWPIIVLLLVVSLFAVLRRCS